MRGLLAGLLLFLVSCGPVQTVSPNHFVVIVHDDSGQGAPLIINRQPPNAVDTLTLPPSSSVLDDIGQPPQVIYIYGGTWITGLSWTSSDFGPFWEWHVFYPSGIAWGSVRR